MKFKEALKQLGSSEEFKEWKKDNPDTFLSHMFYMTNTPIQIGYHNPNTDMVTAFEINHKIEQKPEEQVFKKPEHKINELNIDLVKTTFEDAIKKAQELKKEKHPAEMISKEIVILQTHEDKQIYNITLITQSFKTLNIKINCENNEVIHHELRSILDLGKQVK